MGGQVYDRSSIEKMVGKGDAMFSGQGPQNIFPCNLAVVSLDRSLPL